MTLGGHVWTLWSSVRPSVIPLRAPESRPWCTRLATDRGMQVLNGRWREESSTVAVVVVHGLGGSYHRPYCVRAARALHRHGWSCLRLALRGADHQGEDFYHAGLVEDLAAAIASPTLAAYDRIAVLGYSLGGHVALRYACLRPDPRVRAVAAVCSPLDLARGADHLDGRAWSVYRRHVLSGLFRMAEALHARAPLPTDLERLRRVRGIREWDSLTVVPRFGFADVDDYYRSQSVGPLLGRLAVPALHVASVGDPMIDVCDVETAAAGANDLLDRRVVGRGGHVGFPPDLDLGEDAPRGLEAQILRWMERRLR